jgi:hypothetical protein
MKKVLLVTFSDNADHQDTLFGMYEEMRKRSDWDAYLLCIKTPKVELQQSDHTWLVDCPERPGVTKKTFNLPPAPFYYPSYPQGTFRRHLF